MKDNIEYSKEWLIAEIIRNDFEERRTNQKRVVSMEYKHLLNLVLKFIKLNEEG